MAKVTKHRCAWCEEPLTEEQYQDGCDGNVTCPISGCYWCGIECCGLWATDYEVEE